MNAHKTEKSSDHKNKSAIGLGDLDQMDLNELVALRQKIDAAQEVMLKKKKRAAQDQIREIASDLNISVAELISGMPEAAETDKRTKTKLKPQFRSTDGTEEWSGRGRTPRWVLEYVGVEKLVRDNEEHAAKLEELRIKV